MKIYTKTGDDGTTGLIGGHRVKKTDIRLEAYGTVDELNSWIGLIRSCPNNYSVNQDLIYIQRSLFTICAHLATDRENAIGEIAYISPITEEQSAFIESCIDKLNSELPELSNFIIPGGSQFAAYCHVSRTVCRRAERRILSLAENTHIDKNILIFVNRLSDYLFTLARYCSFKQDVDEIIWKNDL